MDIQLAFKKDDEVAPTMVNLLNGRGITGHMYVRRIDIQSVPTDEAEAAEWLQELFRKKDRQQESFHKHGDFFTGVGMKPIKPIMYEKRISSLLNTVFWLMVTLTPILYYLVQLLFSGKLLYFATGVAIISVCK